jgi:hypothetical protein
MSCSSKNWCM